MRFITLFNKKKHTLIAKFIKENICVILCSRLCGLACNRILKLLLKLKIVEMSTMFV